MTLVNGTYEVFPHRTFNKKGSIIGLYSGLSINNIVGIINGRETSLDTPEEANMHIKFIDEKTVAISILFNSEVIYHQEYKGKFKRNGFFYFDNRIRSNIGIPFIAGGIYRYKSRLGLSQHGSLIIQSVEANIGRILFFIKKGKKKHIVYHFRRLFYEIKV